MPCLILRLMKPPKNAMLHINGKVPNPNAAINRLLFAIEAVDTAPAIAI